MKRVSPENQPGEKPEVYTILSKWAFDENGIGISFHELYITERCRFVFPEPRNFCLVFLLKGQLYVKHSSHSLLLESNRFLLLKTQPDNPVHFTPVKGYIRVAQLSYSEQFLFQLLRQLTPETAFIGKELHESLVAGTFSVNKINAALTRQLDQLIAHNPQREKPPVHAHVYLAPVFGSWLQFSPPASNLFLTQEDVVEKAMLYIEANLLNNFSLKDLYTHVNASESKLRRKFISQSGIRLQDYIIQIRIKKAQELLRLQPKLPIHVIAYMLAFKTPSHFSRFISKNIGVSPKKYRENHLSDEPPV